MKSYKTIYKKVSKWSPSPGFTVVQEHAMRFLLALTAPFFVAWFQRYRVRLGLGLDLGLGLLLGLG